MMLSKYNALFSFPSYLPSLPLPSLRAQQEPQNPYFPNLSALSAAPSPKMQRANRTLLLSSPSRILLLLNSLLRPPSRSCSITAAATTTSSSSSSFLPPTQEHIIYTLKKLQKDPPKALNYFNHAVSDFSFNPSPSSYSLMLRILSSHKDHIKDFWSLLNSMKSNGVSLDQPTYHTILCNFKHQKMPAELSALSQFYSQTSKQSTADSSLISASKGLIDSVSWNDDLASKMSNFPLSETSVPAILREVRSSPLKALAFFRWAASRSPDYRHGPAAYNAMARVLAHSDSIKEFWSLVEEIKQEGIDMDIDSYIKIMRQFLKNTLMEDAVKLYEFMMDGPYKPSVQDCGMLLRMISLSGSPDLGLVSRVVNKYEATGNSLSKVVYDGMHRCFTSNGRFEEAEDIVKRMREAGYEPDNITYSQLVYGLCKAKRFHEAHKVLEKMDDQGCTPDLKTWTVLMQGHCSAGEVDKAVELLPVMIEKGCDADADVLDILVKALCKERKVVGAYSLSVELMEKAKLRPWQATYKFLIEELLKDNRLEEAMKVLVLMKSNKLPPFADPFPSYISKFGTVEDAREFLKALSVKNYPSSNAYLHVFKSFLDQGRYTEAQNLLFKCPHHIRKHAEICKLFGSVEAKSIA